MDYAHGGVSPQECVIPMLLVERSAVAAPARITDVRWNRLRCRVSVAGDVAGLVLDVHALERCDEEHCRVAESDGRDG
ncbi:MAG: hypothetical protein IPN16_17120 [Gemmatimonadetes bacterium]|nr:hypothetical protein [Gemmatimonadota bacterium]